MNRNGRKVTQKRGEVTSRVPDIADENQPGGQRGFDPSVPSPARMWNYWVGGKDHFAADRDAASRIAEAMPGLPLVARSVRKFLIAAVHSLAAEHGIRQFIDIGTGLPTADNTHEVAQAGGAGVPDRLRGLRPVGARPRQGAADEHPRGQDRLHRGGPAGHPHHPGAAAKTLDLSKPVAILLLAVLHFIPDEDDPYGIVRTLLDAVPSGSYLVIVHAPSDLDPEEMAEQTRRYNASGAERMRPRSREEISRFFDGLELIAPGVAPLSDWLPPGQANIASGKGIAGIARKP